MEQTVFFQCYMVATVFSQHWVIDFKRSARLIWRENTITFIDLSFQIATASSHECSHIHFLFFSELQWNDNAAMNAKTLFKGKQSNKIGRISRPSLSVSDCQYIVFRAPGGGAGEKHVVPVLHVSTTLGTTEPRWVSNSNEM